jgi:two-component system cell cycle sensor histidine kinase/response regulator CckA
MTEPHRPENPLAAGPHAPARVLVLEDVPRDADLIVRQLRRAGLTPEIRVVSGRREFIEQLEAFVPDLILADYSLPQFEAPEALQILNQSPIDAAFIIISGTIGEEKAAECIKLGAADYLLKDRLTRLAPAVLQAMEKKDLRSETRRQRDLLQQVIDAIPNPIFYKGVDGRYQGCNAAFASFLGRPKEYIVGRPSADLVPPELAAQYEEIDRALFAEPGTRTYESKVPYADGSLHDVFLNKAPFYGPDGGVTGLVGIMLDITALKKAQEGLKASEAKYRSIVEHIGIGVALISPQMKIVELNPQMRKWFPEARPDDNPLCYTVLSDPPGNGVCDRCPTYATLQDGRVHEVIRETHVGTGDRQFRLASSPIHDTRGQVVAAIEIVEDITERLQMEKQLRQAQKMEAIGTLAGGIAHDFNNILSAILGYSELCLDEAAQGSLLRSNLQEVLHAGHRAKDLVQQILAFSRRSESDLKPVQAGLIVKEALKLLRSTLPVTIEISVRIDSASLVMSDPTQIHQIVMNLCTNAAYAMESNGGVLTVSLTDTAMDSQKGRSMGLVPGPYLRLTVADTGAGIAPQHLEAIFEPYFSTKPEGEGTGLGLSVLHGIVHKLDGGIHVRSQLGQGTVFDIYLPAIERQADINPAEIQQLPRGTERVLFVDDEPQIAMMAKQHLERLGYGVTIRTDSREALELFKIKHADIDLVITDMTMPNMTGDKLARAMMEISPQIPIILCTGFSKELSAQRTAQNGIKAVAMKPLVRSELAQLVRKVLDSEKAGLP